MAQGVNTLLGRLDQAGRFLENIVLVGMLTSMILLAVGQIVLRELFDTGIIWVDELIKLMVLWLAMVGSIAACRDDRHIRIDVLSHVLPEWAIKLTRVVVSSCSPLMHEETFRRTLERAGLNRYLFEMANIRNHDSWVHKNNPEFATKKAKDLVRMAVSKVTLMEPLRETELEVNQTALVIGGGVAGMQAALDLAEAGHQVYLVEKKPSIGGIMAHLDKVYPDIECSI